jgi:hypothetical protein
MPFVNELIPFGSDEAKKLGLPELMKRFRKHEDYMYWVTIDYERNIFFIGVDSLGKDPEDDEYNMLYILNMNGNEVRVRLRSIASNYEGTPGSYRTTMVRWRLIWIGSDPERGFEVDDPKRANVIEILKEVLQVHGSLGGPDVPPNFRAEFEF